MAFSNDAVWALSECAVSGLLLEEMLFPTVSLNPTNLFRRTPQLAQTPGLGFSPPVAHDQRLGSR